MKILVVEDEKSINDLVSMSLQLAGYEVVQVYDGSSVGEILKNVQIGLVLLDVMLPGKDGFELMEQKVFGSIPVIFLTARTNLVERVKGLKLGADDYITKPFETEELLARVEAVLRRTNQDTNEFKIGNTVVYLDKRIVTVNGKVVELRNREYALLETLLKNRNIALSREKLLDLVWGFDYLGDTRTIDVHITNLRKKLELEDYIKTVYKHGYRLEV